MAIRRLNTVRMNPVGELLAQILEFYPKKAEIYITSGTDSDHGSVSHHYGKLSYQGSPTAALDIGGGGVTAEGSRRMRDVAKWLYDTFASLTVELIHTTPYSTDQGFYVKRGSKYPGGGPYAGATARAHANHVHFATSKALAERILATLRGTAVPRPRPASRPAPSPVVAAGKTRLALPYVQAGSFGGARTTTKLLVVHATDNTRASAEDEASYMTHRKDKISCHVVVDQNSAVQTVALDRVAYCAYPTANARSIHMELCGASNAVPTATIARGAKLAAVVCKLWNLPVVSLAPAQLVSGAKGICGHDDVTAAWHTGPDRGASHTDPGTHFPWASFIGQVQAEYNALYAANAGVHVVRSGDTLSAIASHYGITLQQIIKLNPLVKDPDLIRIGQKIRVR